MLPVIALLSILPVLALGSSEPGSLCSRVDSFSNPVIYEDYPDNDVFVGPDGSFYFSASNFHYSPGAPILRSLDLVNWQPVGHSIPRLTFGEGYDLPPNGERAYRAGTWASSLRYRQSNGLWYWIGCTNFWNTWVFTSPSVDGPWTNSGSFGGGNCLYDNGILIDDDDTMYVVSGNPEVRISQLSNDGLSIVKAEVVLRASDLNLTAIEGNRMYKVNDTYYILNDHPGTTTYIWKSDNVWGPYEAKILVDNVISPLEGGSSPHQGSLVKTKNGDWYYMSFTWAYPAGRLPVLAPIQWGADEFPTLVKGDNGGWGKSYPLPLPAQPLQDWSSRSYSFEGASLEPTWEWNHNPDVERFEVNEGLTLRTASVTDDLYSARNTVTHRIRGEYPVGTVEVELSGMADGDRFGLAAFRDRSSYIGIHREGSSLLLNAVHNITIDEYSGASIDPGYTAATQEVPSNTMKIWLRADLDARPTGTRAVRFFYSFDGAEFTQFGESYELYGGWAFFVAYRFGIFNFATNALGGHIKVVSFTIA